MTRAFDPGRETLLRKALRPVLVVALAGALAACGGGGGDGSTGTPTGKSFSGVVTQYDGQGLVVDGILIDTSSLSGLPANLQVGSQVEVDGVMDNGVIMATRLDLDDDSSDDYPDGIRNEIKGRITAITGPAMFSVEGVPVDATGAAVLASGLTMGSLVEVHGILVDGVMVADKVELEDDGSDDDSDDDHDDDSDDGDDDHDDDGEDDDDRDDDH
ncbi:MAG: DUF5666 domain-containing protein [Burkholderiaceae bacterium]